jgi:16S rRNA (cytosine967-C5)-methyltransferase
MTDTEHPSRQSRQQLVDKNLSDSVKARRCAALAVMEVTANGRALELALAETPDYSSLEARDRAFARAIAATVFRRSGQIKAVLKPLVRKAPTAPVKAVLQTAVAQIVFMDVSPHAAVSETVDVLKSSKSTLGFANFANAVLRRVVEQGRHTAAATPPKANIPGWIRGEWERAYGKIPMTKIAVQLIKDPVLDVSVAHNHAGMGRKDMADATGGTPIGRQTLRLDSIGDVTALPGFDEGSWWAQDLAASLPAQILMDQFEDVKGVRALDMCAAPGGKTLQLSSAGMDVTAVDKSSGRLKRLEENLARTKLPATVVHKDALDFESEAFPAVLLDAPCTATGTFRRHPDVLHNRNPKSVADLVRLQDKLLPKAATLTAPGGVLIYAVCSLQPDEGMPRIAKFLAATPEFSLIPIASLPGLDLPQDRFDGGVVRTLPCDLPKSGGLDGFFIAALRRAA